MKDAIVIYVDTTTGSYGDFDDVIRVDGRAEDLDSLNEMSDGERVEWVQGRFDAMQLVAEAQQENPRRLHSDLPLGAYPLPPVSY